MKSNGRCALVFVLGMGVGCIMNSNKPVKYVLEMLLLGSIVKSGIEIVFCTMELIASNVNLKRMKRK